jgi:hypothetical protein
MLCMLSKNSTDPHCTISIYRIYNNLFFPMSSVFSPQFWNFKIPSLKSGIFVDLRRSPLSYPRCCLPLPVGPGPGRYVWRQTWTRWSRVSCLPRWTRTRSSSSGLPKLMQVKNFNEKKISRFDLNTFSSVAELHHLHICGSGQNFFSCAGSYPVLTLLQMAV